MGPEVCAARMAASFPLGVAVDPEAGLALMPGPGPNVICQTIAIR